MRKVRRQSRSVPSSQHNNVAAGRSGGGGSRPHRQAGKKQQEAQIPHRKCVQQKVSSSADPSSNRPHGLPTQLCPDEMASPTTTGPGASECGQSDPHQPILLNRVRTTRPEPTELKQPGRCGAIHVETSFPKETGLPGGSSCSSGEQGVVGARVRYSSSRHISFQLITAKR